MDNDIEGKETQAGIAKADDWARLGPFVNCQTLEVFVNPKLGSEVAQGLANQNWHQALANLFTQC